MAAAEGGWGGQHGTSGVAASGGGEPPRQPNNNPLDLNACAAEPPLLPRDDDDDTVLDSPDEDGIDELDGGPYRPIPAQVARTTNDRARPELRRDHMGQGLDAEQDLGHRREERRSPTTNQDSRELEVIRNTHAEQERQRADIPTEESDWQTTLESLSQYLIGLNPVPSGSYGPDHRGVDHESLLSSLVYFLAEEEERDRFTAFLEAGPKPDGWYCVRQICSSHHSGFEPVDGKCVCNHDSSKCLLQVRHLDASSGGRTLDFRMETPDGGDHDGKEG